MFYVYIATNKVNTVLYTGFTSNLALRIQAHKNKLVDGFTKKYNVDKLVFCEAFETRLEALEAEKIIKGWVRKKKIDLIQKENPDFRDLTEKLN